MKLPPQRMLFFLLPLALGLGGCATTSDLMVPVRPSPMHTLADVPPAKLKIPILVDLPDMKEVEKALVNFVKEDFKKTEASLTKSMGTKVWWDPLAWDFQGNTMTAHATVHVNTGEKDANGKDIQKDVQVDLGSGLRWNKDWQLEAPEFGEKPEETTTPVPDGDDERGKKLVKKGTSKYNEALRKKTDLRSRANDIWIGLQKPIQLSEDMWLQVIPVSVSVSECHIIPDPKTPKMETGFEIIASPRVVFGKKPEPLKDGLPPLTPYTAGPDGFHAKSNLKLSFGEVNKLLKDPKIGIVGKALPGGQAYHIMIEGIRLYGSGGQMVVEAQVQYQPVLDLSKKPAELMLYLLGTPHYHEDSQTIDFPDLEYDVKSSDFLVNMATFLDGNGIRDELRKKAVIPVGKDLEKLKGYLIKMLNRNLTGYAKLRTNITTLRLDEAFISDLGIEARVSLDGDATVDVNL